MESALAIAIFFVGHWALSAFFQTFFHHRYASHRMFTMSKGWERFFYLGTLLAQGSSYLEPRAYALLHREHHAFSDGERDPHSPHRFRNVVQMMWATKQRYAGFVTNTIKAEARFEGGYPRWETIDRIGDHWVSRIAFGTLYTLFYIAFAPHWAFYLLLPVHYLMGPVHGAIVNWCGHKYGYRNFDCADKSRNTLPFDFLTWGELFQNNHHRFGQAVNFAARKWEIDPAYFVICIFAALGIVKFPEHRQRIVWAKAA